jgi:hypothetical protein
MIRKSQIMLLSFAALSVVIGQPARAGFSSGDAVTLGGQPAFTMAGSAGGYTADHRAWLAQDALDNALVLSANRSPDAVTVGRENGAITVLLDGRRVATADANSAQLANMTAEQLAQSWAQSIKNFLSDSDRTEKYVATLKRDHSVQASVLVAERTFYAPSGMTIPVSLTQLLSCKTVSAGDQVEAKLDADFPLGNYMIPAGSVVTGMVCEPQPNNFSISFSSICTPNGTLLPINAEATDEFVIGSLGPHCVSTYVIPSGMANGMPLVAGRVPARIGIGTSPSGSSLDVLVFHRNSNDLAVGRPMNVVFEKVTQVAVVMRDKAM